MTHVQALELLLERSREFQTPEVARRLVVLASVGLDGEHYDFDMAPYIVRRMGLGALARVDARFFRYASCWHRRAELGRRDRDGQRLPVANQGG